MLNFLIFWVLLFKKNPVFYANKDQEVVGEK